MAEYEPYTKEERETHAAFCERQLRVRIGNSEEAILHDMAHLSLRYEATVQDRDDRIAALEADNARLRQLAEVGEAVEGMELGDGLFREGEHEWRVRSDLEYETSNWEIVDNAPTPLAAFEAMKQKRAKYEAAVARADDAALRAAKGEADAHYP